MVHIGPLYHMLFNMKSKKKKTETVSNNPRICKSWGGTPYQRQRLLVRNLRTKIDKLEDKLETIQNIVGSNLISLSKSDDRIKRCFEVIQEIFEEEENRSAEHHVKASFLLDQVFNLFYFFIFHRCSLYGLCITIIDTQFLCAKKQNTIWAMVYKICNSVARKNSNHI
jgi:hypothetical protein